MHNKCMGLYGNLAKLGHQVIQVFMYKASQENAYDSDNSITECPGIKRQHKM